MTPHHFVVTLAGTSQPLTTNKALVGYYVTVQPLGANAGIVYVGGRNSSDDYVVSSTDYGIYISAPVSTIPPAPLPIDPWNRGLMVNLNTIQIIGTENDKVAVMYWS